MSDRIIKKCLDFLFSDDLMQRSDRYYIDEDYENIVPSYVQIDSNNLDMKQIRFLKFFFYYLTNHYHEFRTQESFEIRKETNVAELPPYLIPRVNVLENYIDDIIPHPDLHSYEGYWRGNPRFLHKPYPQMLFHWIVFFLRYIELDVIPNVEMIISYTDCLFSLHDLKLAVNLSKSVIDYYDNKNSAHPTPYNISARKKYPQDKYSGIYDFSSKKIKSLLLIIDEEPKSYSILDDQTYNQFNPKEKPLLAFDKCLFIESDKKWVVFSSGTIFDAVILPTCYFVVIFNEDYIFPNDFRYFIDNKIPELVFSTVLLHHNYLEKEIKDLFSLLTNEDFDGIQKKKEKLAQHSPFFHDYFFDSYLNYESPEEHSPGCHKIWKIGAFLRNRNLIS